MKDFYNLKSSTMTLDEIAIKHNCDKSSLGHDYCRIYAELISNHFKSRREMHYRVTEIGYFEGASARMWVDWLDLLDPVRAQYVSLNMVDIENKTPIEGINFIHSDAKDPQLATNPFVIGSDIIIDDGSHVNADIIATFKNLWPVLAPGGLYCVEDIHSSWDPYYPDSSPYPGAKGTAMQFFSDLAYSVNYDFIPNAADYGLRSDIEYVHLYKDLVIIKKKS